MLVVVIEGAASLLVGMTLLTAGVTKLVNRRRFTSTVLASPILSPRTAAVLSRTVPISECALGIWLLLLVKPVYAFSIAVLVFAIFGSYRLLLHRICPECGCGCGMQTTADGVLFIALQCGTPIAVSAIGILGASKSATIPHVFFLIGAFCASAVILLGIRKYRLQRRLLAKSAFLPLTG